jgi:hypothetical protein
MTQQPQPSKQAFVLAIDEDRCEALQVMMTCILRDWFGYASAHPNRAQVMLPVFMAFAKEIAEKQHELGWCKDPNCEHNNE